MAERGAAAVEEDRVAVGDHGRGGRADPAFFDHLLLPPRGQRKLIWAADGRDGAAVRADDEVALGQGLEVGADGDFRDAELLAEIGDRCAAGLVDPVEDLLAALFEKEVSDGFWHGQAAGIRDQASASDFG